MDQITKDEIDSYINRNKNKCHSLKELASLTCLKNDIKPEINDLKIYFSELIEKIRISLVFVYKRNYNLFRMINYMHPFPYPPS